MVNLAFDDEAADALAAAATDAYDTLGNQGLRSQAVTIAVKDFAGTYAQLFTAAAQIEAEDRGKLAGVLYDLALNVRQATHQAGLERERQRQLEAWQLQHPPGQLTTEGVGLTPLGVARKPSTSPVRPAEISAAFQSRPRTRNSGSKLGGTSSADPERLRAFVSQSRRCNTDVQQVLARVKAAWAQFRSACSWVPVGSSSFLGGMSHLLDENEQDVAWMDRVATAFEVAGGRAVMNFALDLAASTALGMKDAQVLAALASLSKKELVQLLAQEPGLLVQLQHLDPATIFAWWQGLNPPEGAQDVFSKQQNMLLKAFPNVFGNLEGLPYKARNEANRIALKAAIADIEAQIKGATDAKQRAALQDQLAALRGIQAGLKVPQEREPRYLISFTLDHPPLAAIAIGDLDTATSVSYLIPGMGTTTKNMRDWAIAAQNIRDMLPPGSAVVAWIGYHTPPVPSLSNPDLGVLSTAHAVAGGSKLDTALTGLTAVRAGSMPTLNIVAFSYGTTTAAVTLAQSGGVHVDAFITLGSAGLPDSVRTTADLNAGAVFSGQARMKIPGEQDSGDEWAWIGRSASQDHHLDPVDPDFGSRVFGVETGGEAGKAVTEHSATSKNGTGYLDNYSESLQNTIRAIEGATAGLTPYAPLGPTAGVDALRQRMNGNR